MSSEGNKSGRASEKQKRLSEALRENLLRRKSQSRGRKQVQNTDKLKNATNKE